MTGAAGVEGGKGVKRCTNLQTKVFKGPASIPAIYQRNCYRLRCLDINDEVLATAAVCNQQVRSG